MQIIILNGTAYEIGAIIAYDDGCFGLFFCWLDGWFVGWFIHLLQQLLTIMLN